MSTEKPKTKRNGMILLGIIVGIILLCPCLIFMSGLLRGISEGLSGTMEPTQVENIGATVVVNQPTKEPPTDTPVPYGQARDNPHPLNTPVDVGGDMELTVLGVERPADQKVAEGNMFNDAPPAGMEYMIVSLGVKCNKPSNEKCTFDSYNLKTVGADGQVKDQASVAGVPGEMEAFPEFFGGSIAGGQLVFLARQGDDRTVLFYDPMFSEHLVYFALD